MDETSDIEIIQTILAGDVDKFEVLIDRYRAYIFSLIARKIPADEVEEVSQKVFLKAFRSLATFSQKSEFRHWMAQIATRACYDFWRKFYRQREISSSQLGSAELDWMELAMSTHSINEMQKQASAKKLMKFCIMRWINYLLKIELF